MVAAALARKLERAPGRKLERAPGPCKMPRARTRAHPRPPAPHVLQEERPAEETLQGREERHRWQRRTAMRQAKET